MLAGGMMSRTGGHENTLSLRQKGDSQQEQPAAGPASQPDNYEERQLTVSATDAKAAFGHKQSNRSLPERDSNTNSMANNAGNA